MDGVFSLFGDLYLLPERSTDFLGEEPFSNLEFSLSYLLFLMIRLKPNFCANKRFLESIVDWSLTVGLTGRG